MLLTFLIALFVMGIVVAGLAIGLLITGKSRLRRGCGMAPKKGNTKTHNDSQCSLCGSKKECEEKNEPDS